MTDAPAGRPGPFDAEPPAVESSFTEASRVLAATWRIEAAKIVAALTRHVGDFGFAEDLAQEALTEALTSWSATGIPANPAGWLMTVAKRRAIDSWRRRERFETRVTEIGHRLEDEQASDAGALPWDPDTIDDDVLRLIFISCHPVLGREAQLALTLRVVGGLTTQEIARAFLVPVATVQQRIVRAKKTLALAEVPFELPPANEWPGRLTSVLSVLYLMFSEGHVATAGADWMKPELSMDALRLTRITAGLVPEEPEVHGLIALMAFTAARFPARLRPDETPILLADQDRSRWDRSLIRLGERSLHRAERLHAARAVPTAQALHTAQTPGTGSGPYTLQAAIAAVHASARRFPDTDWERIAQLYGELETVAPSPMTTLNRAIAIAEAESPEAGLRVIEDSGIARALARFHHVPSVRGELLARAGRTAEALTEFDRAAELAVNDREAAVLRDKADRLREA